LWCEFLIDRSELGPVGAAETFPQLVQWGKVARAGAVLGFHCRHRVLQPGQQLLLPPLLSNEREAGVELGLDEEG